MVTVSLLCKCVVCYHSSGNGCKAHLWWILFKLIGLEPVCPGFNFTYEYEYVVRIFTGSGFFSGLGPTWKCVFISELFLLLLVASMENYKTNVGQMTCTKMCSLPVSSLRKPLDYELYLTDKLDSKSAKRKAGKCLINLSKNPLVQGSLDCPLTPFFFLSLYRSNHLLPAKSTLVCAWWNHPINWYNLVNRFPNVLSATFSISLCQHPFWIIKGRLVEIRCWEFSETWNYAALRVLPGQGFHPPGLRVLVWGVHETLPFLHGQPWTSGPTFKEWKWTAPVKEKYNVFDL